MNDIIKLGAWDFVPGQNPIGFEATVHIPYRNIIWLSHSGSDRLDIGLASGVIHLLQRDNDDANASKDEIARSNFNLVGSAYWIEKENGINILYEQLQNQLFTKELAKQQIVNAMDLRSKLVQLRWLILDTLMDVSHLYDNRCDDDAFLNEWFHNNPLSFKRFKEFQETCQKIHYFLNYGDPEMKLFGARFQLLPQWMAKDTLIELQDLIRRLNPFTLASFYKFSHDKASRFIFEGKISEPMVLTAILDAIRGIDDLFPVNGSDDRRPTISEVADSM